MTDQPIQVGGGRNLFGDFAPKLAELTDDVLFAGVWNRPELSARDRSLITVAVLAANGDTTHVTFYAGWPRGMAAMGVAKQIFTENK
jgi:4-carboxymuconolactone decarboxylase